MHPGLQKKVVASIYSCPNGTIRMSDGIPGLVETSTNLAIVRTDERTGQYSLFVAKFGGISQRKPG